MMLGARGISPQVLASVRAILGGKVNASGMMACGRRYVTLSIHVVRNSASAGNYHFLFRCSIRASIRAA